MAKRAQRIWFFRWTRSDGEKIQQFKRGVLEPTSNGAFWVFDLRKPYRPQRKLVRGRLLVAFDFGARGVSMLENESLHVTFPKPEFLGETKHPSQIIVKENEEGAYGIGHLLLRTFPVNAIRLATRGRSPTHSRSSSGCSRTSFPSIGQTNAAGGTKASTKGVPLIQTRRDRRVVAQKTGIGPGSGMAAGRDRNTRGKLCDRVSNRGRRRAPPADHLV